MKKMIISGQPCILGECCFIKEPFLNLLPGAKITKIGTGKHTGCYSTLRLKTYMTYVGSITIEKEKRFAFEIRPEEIDGWDLFEPMQKVYALFVKVGTDVGKEDWDNNRLIVYKGVFKKYNA